MNSREQSDMPPAPSYPSPNGAQMAQGAMPYYANRQMTTDELLSAELSREASGPGLGDGSNNGVHHNQGMVLDSSNTADMSRASNDTQQQHQHQHQQHMLQFPPSQQVGVDPNHDLSYGSQSARKRSKISRACDECRRKKVRCDASSDTGLESCSNCRRLGVVCQFSRVPMKRGPSKGYIKELAERLHTLENQMHPGMVQSDVPYQSMNEVSLSRGYQDFPSPVEPVSASRKRAYSVFESLPGSSFAQPSFHRRGSQNSFGTPEATADAYQPVVAAGSAPKPGQPFWHPTGNEQGIPHDLEITDLSKHDGDDNTAPMSLDEGALDAYYQNIHPILPILPHTKERTLEFVHQQPRRTQEIFAWALYAVTRTDMARVAGNFEMVSSFDNAQDLLLNHIRQLVVLQPTSAILILLQTLILIIVDCDTRGPDNFVGAGGVPKHTFVQTAFKLGCDLTRTSGLMVDGSMSEAELASLDADLDSDGNLIRRIWASLLSLARWHDVSVADSTVYRGQGMTRGPHSARNVPQIALVINSYSGLLTPTTTLVMEEENVCLTEFGLGRALGDCLIWNLEECSRTRYWATLRDENERPLFESLHEQLFWTVQLLIKRHTFVYSPVQIVHCALKVVNELHRSAVQNRLATPFDLHCLLVASMTLLEATALPAVADTCWESLAKVEEILDLRSQRSSESAEFSNIFGTPGWDAKIRRLIAWRRSTPQEHARPESGSAGNAGAGSQPPVMGLNEQRSLQHLADLAVGAEGAVGQNALTPPAALAADQGETSPNLVPQPSQTGEMTTRITVDFTKLLKMGYMNVISGLVYLRDR